MARPGNEFPDGMITLSATTVVAGGGGAVDMRAGFDRDTSAEVGTRIPAKKNRGKLSEIIYTNMIGLSIAFSVRTP